MKYDLEEETIQAGAVQWLSRVRGYREAFEDSDESSNARLDSVGLLEGRVCFVETKVRVDLLEARRIESKISGALLGHANPNDDHPLFVAMRSIWDGSVRPLVAVLARDYLDSGLSELLPMLEKRGMEWGFDYVLWRWTGIEVEEIAASAPSAQEVRDPDLFIEEIRLPSPPRAPAATRKELEDVAEGKGVRVLFDLAVESALSIGLVMERRRGQLTLTWKRGRGGLALLPRLSSPETGLVFDCGPDLVPHLQQLPLSWHGRGMFSSSRCSTADPGAVCAVVEAMAKTRDRDALTTVERSIRGGATEPRRGRDRE